VADKNEAPKLPEPFYSEKSSFGWPDLFTRDQLLQAVREERERCAALCDERVLYTGYDCAAAIRSQPMPGGTE
jgi:hypothetical protein